MNPSVQAAILVLATTTAAVAHPDHVSYSEIEFNARTRSLEISLQVRTCDLEQALTAKKTTINLANTKDKQNRAKVAGYIRKRFLITADKKPLAAKFVGYETNPRAVWIYLELPLDQKTRRIKIENRVFFGMLDEQKNQLAIKVGKERQSLLCTEKQPRHSLLIPPPPARADGR